VSVESIDPLIPGAAQATAEIKGGILTVKADSTSFAYRLTLK
jgi:hypothetical protein